MKSGTFRNPYESCPVCGNNKSAVSDQIGLCERVILRLETERKLLVRRNMELTARLQDFQGVGGQEYGWRGFGEYLMEPEISWMLSVPPTSSMLSIPPTSSMLSIPTTFPMLSIPPTSPMTSIPQQLSTSPMSPSSPNHTSSVYTDDYSNVEKTNELEKAVDVMTREEGAKSREPLHVNAKQFHRILRRRKARHILQETLRLRGGRVLRGNGRKGRG